MDVTVEDTIGRPRADVAAYLADNRNDPAWIGGVSTSELLGDPPVRIGSRVRRVAGFMGKRIEYVNEVVRLGPSVLEMRSVESPFPMRVTYAFEEASPGTTHVRIRVEGEPGAWYRVAGPLLRAQVRRSVRRDLASLRRILEA